MAASPSDWVALDKLLLAACQELDVGQMVQAETFSLFEAMSACELGNPKMDTTAVPAPSVEELIQQGLAPATLSPEQQLAVMDRLLLLESSHYCFAAPLACSVYTSLYMMRPDRLRELCPLLHAFCEGLSQTCAAVRWLVYHGAVFEEEDYHMLVAGLPCAGGAAGPAGEVPEPLATCMPLLDAACQSAQQQQKAAATAEPEAGRLLEALLQRLTLRRELHACMLALRKKSVESVARCHEHLAAALQALEACAPPAEVADAAAAGAPASAGAGLAPVVGCVEGLNRHLLGPAPPRTVTVPAPHAAWSAFKTMLQHLQAALQVTHATGFRDVQQFIARFAGLRAGVVARSAAHYLVAGQAWTAAAALPGSSAAAQAAGANSTAPGTGADGGAANSSSAGVPWALDRPLLCEALALPQKPVIAEEVELFLEQAAIAVGNWAQAMLVNPCRSRRRLRRGLDDWANLYQHALNADLCPAFTQWMSRTGWVWTPGQAGPPNPTTGEPDLQGPLATWVEGFTAGVQLRHLQLGWPLELYRAQEYPALYWYTMHLAAAAKTSSQLLHSVRAPAGGKLPPSLEPGKAGKAKAKVKAKAPPESPATTRRQLALVADAVYSEMGTHMASSLVRLCLGLQAAGLVPQPNLPFSTPREWFDQRFGAFHAPNLVRPEPLGYEHLQQAIQVDLPAPKLLALAADGFALLRRTFASLKQQQATGGASVASTLSTEQLAELASMDRVAAANGLAAMLVARSVVAEAGPQGASSNKVAVTFDLSQHPVYPTLKVKSVSSPSKAAQLKSSA